MRTWTRLSVLAGGMVLLTGAFMPWLREIRPIQVSLGFLLGAGDRMAVLHRGGPEVAAFPGSVGMLLVLVALLAVVAGYAGYRTAAVTAGLVGLASTALFYGQMLFQAGQLPEFSYGATVSHLGIGLILLGAAWPPPGPELFEPYELDELRAAEEEPRPY